MPKDATKKTGLARKLLFAGAGAVVVGGIALALWLWPRPTTTVSIGTATVIARLATTEQERTVGLSGATGLKAGEGMLFVFPHDEKWPFWMKDMKFSIDILWLDSEKRVVWAVSDASPELYPQTLTPTINARYVLELPAGTIEKSQITLGTAATFSLP